MGRSVGLAHTDVWWLRAGRITSSAEVHTGIPSQEQQCWEDESPQQLAVKISRDLVLVRRRAAVDQSDLFKGWNIDSLNHKHSS